MDSWGNPALVRRSCKDLKLSEKQINKAEILNKNSIKLNIVKKVIIPLIKVI